MSRGAVRGLLYAGLVLLFLLHQDLWFWDDARKVAGLPVGLTYHVAYCLVASGLMALLVRFDRPKDEDASPAGDAPR